MRCHTRSQSESTSAPHTAPIDESSTFSPPSPPHPPPIEPHVLREAAKENMDRYRRGQGCAGLSHLAICSTSPGAANDTGSDGVNPSPLLRFSGSACDQ